MFHVYFLRSLVNNDLYIGSTGNLQHRIEAHNSGMVRSTKAYRPWQLLGSEECATRSEAMKQEKFFKSHQQRELLKKKYYMAT